jgi:hypothetical protein
MFVEVCPVTLSPTAHAHACLPVYSRARCNRNAALYCTVPYIIKYIIYVFITYQSQIIHKKQPLNHLPSVVEFGHLLTTKYKLDREAIVPLCAKYTVQAKRAVVLLHHLFVLFINLQI